LRLGTIPEPDSRRRTEMRATNYLGTLACVTVLTRPALAVECIRGPYLQDAAPGAVTIRWELDRLGPSSLEFGPPGATRQRVDCKFQGRKHRVRLTGLRPGQQYRYRLFVKGQPV